MIRKASSAIDVSARLRASINNGQYSMRHERSAAAKRNGTPHVSLSKSIGDLPNKLVDIEQAG